MKCLSAIIIILISIQAPAQVKGKVTDKKGEALPFANVFWLHTNTGVSANENGQYAIDRSKESNKLVFSFMGFKNDTITVNNNNATLNVELEEDGVLISEVGVEARQMGRVKMRKEIFHSEMITSTELLRAACCNLGESFTTNPSVDVSYSDAATGAKQIKLLGLSGTYVQILTENIPNYRGASTPYSLGYVPGPWMQSIQVSKGTSSVKNGYEAIAGQINIEFKKPQSPKSASFNTYYNSKDRAEVNFDGNINLNARLHTSLLAHYENEGDVELLNKNHDLNSDGFFDMPKINQVNVQNRWAWMGDNYVFQASVKALKEKRRAGQDKHSDHFTEPAEGIYSIGIDTERYEAFTKNAYIIDKERNTNIALILSGTLHKQDAGYGYKIYNVNQKDVYASLMFETEFSKSHSLSTGLSLVYDHYDQDHRLTNNTDLPLSNDVAKETVAGAYAQYTLNLRDKLTLMAGIRGDYSNRYDFFFTPRTHLKWNPNEYVNVRLSAGKGYRTTRPLAENNYLLAGGREIVVDTSIKQEEAWNYGAGVTGYIPVAGRTLQISAEYFYTDFSDQMVVNLENPGKVQFGNLNGKSYSHVLQLEASYPLFEGMNFTAAYRYMKVKTTYGIEEQNRQTDYRLLDKPLTGRYKGLLTASYHTPLELWQFDVTCQLNGGGRMPNPNVADGVVLWNTNFKPYRQLNAQITRFFRKWSVYVGGENITNFRQKNPIVGADDPWGNNFDATMVWGPAHGAIYYIGWRLTLE